MDKIRRESAGKSFGDMFRVPGVTASNPITGKDTGLPQYFMSDGRGGYTPKIGFYVDGIPWAGLTNN